MKDGKILLYCAHVYALAFLFFILSYVFYFDFGFSMALLKLSQSVFLIASFLLLAQLFFLKAGKKPWKNLKYESLSNLKIAVGMTAYNDRLSIKEAAEDFLKTESVCKVIVVDNNSVDGTYEEALKSTAMVVKEKVQGYGACCKRALREAMKHSDIICLVEGDLTFSASDLKKLAAYLENADMVLGTRTTKELNTSDSQMTFSLQWGNVFMAKLMQLRFLSVRLTDMGCTFRLIKKTALEKIIDDLKVDGNHFSCEMILEALKKNLMIIEIPVSFKKRVGESKGVGSDFFKAAATAFEMWKLIMFK